MVERLTAIARAPGRLTVSGAPEGYDSYAAAEAAKREQKLVLFVAADDARASVALESARFFAADVPILYFPAWDCLPYDRVSPRSDIESQRLATLSVLAPRRGRERGAAGGRGGGGGGGALGARPSKALGRRIPPREFIAGASFLARAG